MFRTVSALPRLLKAASHTLDCHALTPLTRTVLLLLLLSFATVCLLRSGEHESTLELHLRTVAT